MSKLDRHEIKMLESYWINQRDNKKNLQYREWELFTGNDDDQNTGAGKNSVRNISKPTEQMAIKLNDDNKYQHLLRLTTVIDDLSATLDDDTKRIVDMRYKDNIPHEWEEIAEELFMSRSKVLRLRNNLLNQTAKKLGW